MAKNPKFKIMKLYKITRPGDAWVRHVAVEDKDSIGYCEGIVVSRLVLKDCGGLTDEMDIEEVGEVYVEVASRKRK